MTITQRTNSFRDDLSYVRELFTTATSRNDGERAPAANMKATIDLREIIREMSSDEYRKSICGKSKRTIAAWMYHFAMHHLLATEDIEANPDTYSEETKEAMSAGYVFAQKWCRYFAKDLGLEVDDLWRANPNLDYKKQPLQY